MLNLSQSKQTFEKKLLEIGFKLIVKDYSELIEFIQLSAKLEIESNLSEFNKVVPEETSINILTDHKKINYINKSFFTELYESEKLNSFFKTKKLKISIEDKELAMIYQLLKMYVNPAKKSWIFMVNESWRDLFFKSDHKHTKIRAVDITTNYMMEDVFTEISRFIINNQFKRVEPNLFILLNDPRKSTIDGDLYLKFIKKEEEIIKLTNHLIENKKTEFLKTRINPKNKASFTFDTVKYLVGDRNNDYHNNTEGKDFANLRISEFLTGRGIIVIENYIYENFNKHINYTKDSKKRTKMDFFHQNSVSYRYPGESSNSAYNFALTTGICSQAEPESIFVNEFMYWEYPSINYRLEISLHELYKSVNQSITNKQSMID